MAPSKFTRPTSTIGQPLQLGQTPFTILNSHTYIAVLFMVAVTALCLSRLKRHLQKSNSMQELWEGRHDSNMHLPPPPFTTSLQHPLTQDLFYNIAIPTSGNLATKVIPHSGDLPANANALVNQMPGCGHQHPWRRHTHPRPHFADQKEALRSLDPSIRDDAVQHFEDHDLKAVWRRRTLEFENLS